VAQTKPIERELDRLGLPMVRLRKLKGVLNALVMQIEDGGDHPEVNRLLLDALRAGIAHQVGAAGGQAALRAIDAFAQAEAERWRQIAAGTLPPVQLTPEEQLDDRMQEGYDLLDAKHQAQACDAWLAAWDMIVSLARPEMRSVDDFDRAYPGLYQLVFNWVSDLDMALENAGWADPAYHEHRTRFARRFRSLFPEMDELWTINMMRAEGEALWALGRRDQAEAVYQALIDQLPDQAWSYIGWSDQYRWRGGGPTDQARAEALLLRALERPDLVDRRDALDRLVTLYEETGQLEKQAPWLDELNEVLGPARAQRRSASHSQVQASLADGAPAVAPQARAKLGRNDPCWCGSGKKYKRCHLRQDAQTKSTSQ
jgi:tetratricopeptide (TPR) repeat protein